MQLIMIGGPQSDAESVELHFAALRQVQLMPTGVPIRRVATADWLSLEKEALAEVEARGLSDQETVLLLGHAYLLPAPRCLERLISAMAPGAAALAFTSYAPFPGLQPDYFTVRGIERYVARLEEAAPVRYALHGFAPAVLLISVGCLRRGNWRSVAVWVPGAFAHDFSAYHQGAREEVIPLVPMSARRVLDVGGGEGRFLEALKAQRGCCVELAEYSTAACEAAAARVDRVWCGDFLEAPFEQHYDCITFLDVLEHTAWPVDWLLRAREWLSPGGSVVASIPNVGHWSVVADLLEGRWDYDPAGIHCITHLRFFTRFGIEQLFGEAGFELSTVRAVETALPEGVADQFSSSHLRLDSGSLSAVAYLVVARPCQ